MRSPKLRVVLAVCGLAAVAVPAAEAGGPAHVQGVVKIRNSAPAFHGRVVAENGSCNGPRPVKLYERKRNGNRKLLGETVADLDGKWQVIIEPLSSGLYFATAPKADRNDGGVEFVCERAKSRELFVD